LKTPKTSAASKTVSLMRYSNYNGGSSHQYPYIVYSAIFQQ
jgi:hypothetical protein